MNSNNKKHFYRRSNLQMCELLQVLKETTIEMCFEK